MDDCFRKSYREGGLTKKQIIVLFEHHQKRMMSMMEFQAKIHGAHVKDDEKAEETSDIFTFKSPEYYNEKYSPEEKKALTERMKGLHKGNQVLSIGVKKRG